MDRVGVKVLLASDGVALHSCSDGPHIVRYEIAVDDVAGLRWNSRRSVAIEHGTLLMEMTRHLIECRHAGWLLKTSYKHVDDYGNKQRVRALVVSHPHTKRREWFIGRDPNPFLRTYWLKARLASLRALPTSPDDYGALADVERALSGRGAEMRWAIVLDAALAHYPLLSAEQVLAAVEEVCEQPPGDIREQLATAVRHLPTLEGGTPAQLDEPLG